MMKRRTFLDQMAKGGMILASGLPLGMFDKAEVTKVTILHTNDMHSRIDPFPMDGGRFQGLGGMAKRSALIKRLRSENDHVLLLDSGDIFQGTPYFNFFGGELEFSLMSDMQYDVATMGNHDFDAGIDGFKKQLKHANFDFVSSNYDFRDTLLEGQIASHKIIEKAGIRFGIFGLGIELKGLVPDALTGGVQYNDPISIAQQTALKLKNEKSCDYVICLSHLGFKYRENKVSDLVLAKETSNIDLILGGHTHTFLKEIVIKENAVGKPVCINQAGWAGILLGKIDVYFEKNKKSHCKTCKNLRVN